MEKKITELEEKEKEIMAQNAEMKTKLAEKEHLAAHAEKMQIERDDLQQRVRDLEGENSEQQAKLLMSAFNNSSSGGLSSGLAGLSSLGNLSSKAGGT